MKKNRATAVITPEMGRVKKIVSVPCDMIIVHEDELEPLVRARSGRRSASSPRDYLVLGTVDPRVWRTGLAGGLSVDELVQHMADFRRYMQIEYTRRGWRPAR